MKIIRGTASIQNFSYSPYPNKYRGLSRQHLSPTDTLPFNGFLEIIGRSLWLASFCDSNLQNAARTSDFFSSRFPAISGQSSYGHKNEGLSESFHCCELIRRSTSERRQRTKTTWSMKSVRWQLKLSTREWKRKRKGRKRNRDAGQWFVIPEVLSELQLTPGSSSRKNFSSRFADLK